MPTRFYGRSIAGYLTRLSSRAIGTLGIGKGICGLAYYLYYRLSRRKGEEDIKVLRMKEHLIYLIDWIADSLPGVRESSLFRRGVFYSLPVASVGCIQCKSRETDGVL